MEGEESKESKEMKSADRRVGVAVDFSKGSLKAVKWVVDNIARKGDYLILLNIRAHGKYEDNQMQLWKSSGSQRRVGVAVDFSECSNKALRWAMDNVGRNGDHLILIFIKPQGFYEDGEMQLWETTGSPFIPSRDFSNPDVMKKYGVKPDAETLDIVNTAATQKEFEVLMKIYWGDAREKLCEAVDDIPLDCLVIGNRGFGKIKRAIMGSVSNHVVNSAHCPVTVVKDHRE